MQTRSNLKAGESHARVGRDKAQGTLGRAAKRRNHKPGSQSYGRAAAIQKQGHSSEKGRNQKAGSQSHGDAAAATQKEDSGEKSPKKETRRDKHDDIRASQRPDSGKEKQNEDLEGKVMINRAPVLTLWVAVVAEREGYRYEEGLSFGKWIAGVLAHSKGKRLGLYEQSDREERKRKRKEAERFQAFGMKVPGKVTEEHLHLAVQNDKVVHPSSVQEYLLKAFGSNYERVKVAMEFLAKAYSPQTIGKEAYSLYEKFRPQVQHGIYGWGAKGALDFNCLHDLAKQAPIQNA